MINTEESPENICVLYGVTVLSNSWRVKSQGANRVVLAG